MFYTLFLLLLLLPTLAFTQALDRTHVAYRNPLQHGATCDATTLNAAITAIGTAKETLFITRTDRAKVNCTWILAANVTTNVNTEVYIPNGVVLSANNGITVTFNGPVVVDDPVGSLIGAGTYVFNKKLWGQPQTFEDMFSNFVKSGGLHAVPSPASLTTAAFATRAWLNGVEINQGAVAITYVPTVNDVCWTIASSDNDGITGWARVGTTAYYYRCEGDTTPTEPTLPANSAWLMGPILITNSAITTVTDKRTIRALPQPFIYPAMACDGYKDDSAAFQAAYDATDRVNAVIILPRGTCMIATRVNGVSGVSVKGQGAGVTILKQVTNGTLGTPNRLLSYASSPSNITVEGITFDGNFANQSGGVPTTAVGLLGVDSCTNCRFLNNEFKNGYGTGAGSGSMLGIGGTSSNILVHGNYFHDAGTDVTFPSDCLYSSGRSVIVTDNTFNTCTDTATVFESKSTDSANPADRSIIANNTYLGNIQSIGISTADSSSTYTQDTVVVNNVIKGGKTTLTGAIYFYPVDATFKSIKNVVISNNVITDTTTGYGIFIFNGENITLANNVVSGAGRLSTPWASWSGIFIGRSTLVSLVGNRAYKNGNAGIAIQGSNNIILQSNDTSSNAQATGSGGTGIGIGKYSATNTESSDIKLIGNISTGLSQTNGLLVSDATNQVALLANDFRGNTSASVSIGASVTNMRRYANLTEQLSGTPVTAIAEEQDISRIGHNATVTFASLVGGTTGTVFNCTDCRTTVTGGYAGPCQGGGTGAVAVRTAGTWICLGAAGP